jgi:rSAM/selenodomain-associated transferase 1
MRRAILLFVKYPDKGKVKTRLAATVGDDRAVEIYRQLVATVCAQLPPSGTTVAAMYDPPGRMRDTEAWLQPLCSGRDLLIRPQAFGDLGVRLEEAFRGAFREGFTEAAAIGSDCVDIAPELFDETWTALETHDVVLGPTTDGGYYLIALKGNHPELFRGISWSTETACEETVAAAEAAGLRVYRLRELCDVDTEDDWRRVQARLKA